MRDSLKKKEKERKEKNEKKIHVEVELYVKSDTACSKSGFPRVQPRFRGRAETFPGNLSTRVENESAAVYSRVRFPPSSVRRETFLI